MATIYRSVRPEGESVVMDRERLTELLESLGDTADQVASTIAGAGIKGRPGTARACPLANWLRRQGVGHPSVGPNNVVDCVHDGEPCGCTRVDLPEPVRQFVRWVDASSLYDDLVEDMA